MHRVLTVAALLLAVAAGEPSAQNRPLKPIMREKLANTQQLLEGVVTADYAIMRKYGDRLGELTFTEITSWQGSGLPDYLRHARSFLQSIEGLRIAVAGTNFERAAAEYVKLVSSCTQCHAYVRVSRQAAIPHELKPFALH